MHSFPFCICIASVLAERSRAALGLPCHRARMADSAPPFHRIEAAAQARSAPAPALLPDLG
eukprot:4422501-Pleurochrysis_carterae.AAC.1